MALVTGRLCAFRQLYKNRDPDKYLGWWTKKYIHSEKGPRNIQTKKSNIITMLL